MTNESINDVRREARRVLKMIDTVMWERKSCPSLAITGTKNSGALRRASMDLTRALAELRRGRGTMSRAKTNSALDALAEGE